MSDILVDKVLVTLVGDTLLVGTPVSEEHIAAFSDHEFVGEIPDVAADAPEDIQAVAAAVPEEASEKQRN